MIKIIVQRTLFNEQIYRFSKLGKRLLFGKALSLSTKKPDVISGFFVSYSKSLER